MNFEMWIFNSNGVYKKGIRKFHWCRFWPEFSSILYLRGERRVRVEWRSAAARRFCRDPAAAADRVDQLTLLVLEASRSSPSNRVALKSWYRDLPVWEVGNTPLQANSCKLLISGEAITWRTWQHKNLYIF